MSGSATNARSIPLYLMGRFLNPMTSQQQNQFVTGTDVFDTNGDKVGTLDQPPVRDGALVVQKGFFFPHDIYVPLSAASRTTPDGIYLSLSKDQLNGDEFKQPPAAGSVAGGAYQRQTLDSGDDYARNTATTAGAGQLPAGRDAAGSQTARAGERSVDVPVIEEGLVADKQREQLGDVRIHKDVTTQQQTIEVPVSHEEVHVERVPVSDQDATNLPKDAFKEGTIDVPVYGEEVEVEKVPRVTGEVEVEKQRVTDERRFTDTVRKEQVHVDEVNDQGQPVNLDDLNQDQLDESAQGPANQP